MRGQGKPKMKRKIIQQPSSDSDSSDDLLSDNEEVDTTYNEGAAAVDDEDSSSEYEEETKPPPSQLKKILPKSNKEVKAKVTHVKTEETVAVVKKNKWWTPQERIALLKEATKKAEIHKPHTKNVNRKEKELAQQEMWGMCIIKFCVVTHISY